MVTAEHIFAKARIFSEGARISGMDIPPFRQGLAISAKSHPQKDQDNGPNLKIAPEQIEQIWKIASQTMEASAKESKPSSATK